MNIAAALRVACMAVLDAVLPRKERVVRTESREAADIPLSLAQHDLLGVRITTLLDYRDRRVVDLIQSLKYDGSKHAAQLAADVLSEYLIEELASHTLFSAKKILLVPVPLYAARERARGFNQIQLVLEALPPEFKDGTSAQLATDVLQRTRATQPQTKLQRGDRLSNVAGAFALNNIDAVDDSVVVFLIDDVTTTGATLANAAQPLRRRGAAVYLLALARA